MHFSGNLSSRGNSESDRHGERLFELPAFQLLSECRLIGPVRASEGSYAFSGTRWSIRVGKILAPHCQVNQRFGPPRA